MNIDKDITGLLNELNNGSSNAYDKLFPLVYGQLKELAIRQLQPYQCVSGYTYSKTDLVHEAYLKFIAHPPKQHWQNRSHFFGVAARCMRSILIDYARKKTAEKRGGQQKAITYFDQWVSVRDEAEYILELDRALHKLDKFNKRLVRVVELRYFADLSIDDIAKIMAVSPRTVKRDWAKARGWLYRELKNE